MLCSRQAQAVDESQHDPQVVHAASVQRQEPHRGRRNLLRWPCREGSARRPRHRASGQAPSASAERADEVNRLRRQTRRRRHRQGWWRRRRKGGFQTGVLKQAGAEETQACSAPLSAQCLLTTCNSIPNADGHVGETDAGIHHRGTLIVEVESAAAGGLQALWLRRRPPAEPCNLFADNHIYLLTEERCRGLVHGS